LKKFTIDLSEDLSNQLKGKVGVDAGASLTKIAFENKKKLVCVSFPTNLEAILNFLKNVQTFQVNLTGGRAFEIYNKFCKGKNCNLLNEFETEFKGIEILFGFNKKNPPKKALLASVGTGTSILYLDYEAAENNFERAGGSALGGGTFMGLIKLLFNMEDYEAAIDLAKKGNPYNVDLKVSDIYDDEDDRIDALFRQFTASSLGKVAKYREEDVINSIIALISENLASQLILYAKNRNVKDIILSGGFLNGNFILKQVVSIICKLNGIKPYFLKYNDFVSAFGAINI
jgi:type II pantothenate kinase